MESDSSSDEPGPPETCQGHIKGVSGYVAMNYGQQRDKKIQKDSRKLYKTNNGKHKNHKQLRVMFSCHCPHHCSSRGSLAERKHIFDEFYQLPDHDVQNKYLLGHIECCYQKLHRPW